MKTASQLPMRWRRISRWAGIAAAGLAAAALAWGWHAFRDRNPAYHLAIEISDFAARRDPRPLRVGFGRVKINPDLSGASRPVWLAGFNQDRAATALHDDLWAVACVLDDGHNRLGIAVLDAIGLFHDDVIAVRRALRPEWRIVYAVVCATHNHNTPDLMGLWGPDSLRSGVDPCYRDRVIAATAAAFGEAVASLREARVAFHEIPTTADGLLADTRLPEIFDHGIRVMHFLDATGPETLGTLVAWANHPETVWSDNTEITADFPGYLREVLERGVTEASRTLEPGLGGIHLYVNGAIGGLLSTTPQVTVRDPYREEDFREPSHDKAQALGRQLASRILPRLRDPQVAAANHLPLAIAAKTIELPVDNPVFLLASCLGLLDRGYCRWKTLRSEVALIRLGPASAVCIPGEIYPELVNGGIEISPGADFPTAPAELPPIRELMPGDVKFVFGLANDEIGYIIPRSQWDEKPPYLYHSPKPVYGEIVSLGPDTATHIHAAIAELAERGRALPSSRRVQGRRMEAAGKTFRIDNQTPSIRGLDRVP